ncbi:NAD(P)-dependent methylenetetrahydromethanopterin dehydrogenase [Methylomonas methanica]|uniref:Methylenetetrahydromethanopterin dehydrogenase n=1 Tax=Methylomonas methanica TaxID=421 RepID=A0A177MP68_METMH|nr:NAD(P)-dependent methylenetetrahydromethanopterin dehydrogenase [Methylomonas methanica]OAI07587.1 methylenetetrahydromethanopterin dehydrogenase [Methylomonas methanica]
MTKKILYFLTPSDNISPFDVTIAADAGFDMVVPFTKVEPKQVSAMVQDAIFCRPPNRFNDTGIFIGGRDVHMATDMFQNAKNAMVGPFKVGVFADPNGAYTTSASIVALIEQVLNDKTGNGLSGKKVAIFGTGPVGLCTAILATQQGAKVKLCQLVADDDERSAQRFCERYNTQVEWVSAQTNDEKDIVVREAEIIVSAVRAGVRILENSLAHAANLILAADTNAVPPSGVAGIGLNDLGVVAEVSGTRFLSIGPMAIGNLKYKTQFGLYEQIQKSSTAALIDFPEAYEFALSVLKQQAIKPEKSI